MELLVGIYLVHKKKNVKILVLVWRREETRWVRCTARRTRAFDPTLTASGLAAKRRAECAGVNLSRYFVMTAAAVGLRVRIHGEVHAECASLGV